MLFKVSLQNAFYYGKALQVSGSYHDLSPAPYSPARNSCARSSRIPTSQPRFVPLQLALLWKKFSQKYTQLQWSKGTHFLTFHSLQTKPAHTRASHRWLVVLWKFASTCKGISVPLCCYTTPLIRLSSFLYICINMHVSTYLLQ